jgi:hypothetical protein
MEVNSSRIAAGMPVIDGALLVLDLVDDSKTIKTNHRFIYLVTKIACGRYVQPRLSWD